MTELRKRLFVDEWVVIAPERAERPRQLDLSLASNDGPCPFCPENSDVTPPTIDTWPSPAFDDEPWGVRAIPNKFPALRVEEQPHFDADDPASPYRRRPGIGAHEVIVEAPDHVTGWHELSVSHLARIFGAWQDRIDDLRGDERLEAAVVFKNHGARAGATLAHTHSQLVALPLVPPQLHRELTGARQYFEDHDDCALCAMIDFEQSKQGQRIVVEHDDAVAMCPFGSRTAFETWIAPVDHRGDFSTADESQLEAIAELTASILDRWRQAIGPVAYNLILHSLPFDLAGEPYYHWHLEFIPRIGQVAGFEWGSDMFINATPSEVAARHLRTLDTHPD